MPEGQAQTGAQKIIGDFAPTLVSLTDDVLVGDIWKRPELAPRNAV
jgi:4-carboxymuconolactone decarboxylase